MKGFFICFKAYFHESGDDWSPFFAPDIVCFYVSCWCWSRRCLACLWCLYPSGCPWSCERARWWTCPLCTFGWTRRRVRTSIPEASCSIRRRCRPPRGGPSTAGAPPRDRIPRLPRSWTGRRGPDCPVMDKERGEVTITILEMSYRIYPLKRHTFHKFS